MAKIEKQINDMRIQYTIAFAEWIGENRITYDGYKIWTRKLSSPLSYLSGRPITYNTQQLLEQYFIENP